MKTFYIVLISIVLYGCNCGNPSGKSDDETIIYKEGEAVFKNNE